MDALIRRCAKHIRQAQALVILSGAGMSVDSGLPDFSGDQGLIKRLEKVEGDYRNIISPKYFEEKPEKFWYIYGDRYNQYTKATPHKGYELLLDICEKKKEYFIRTSNVDNMWARAGFDQERIYEIHGSIYHLQCHSC